MHGGRTMGKYIEVFVAFDVAKKKHAVAIAEGGRTGGVRFLGDVENSPLPIERTIKRWAGRYDRLHICFEAGPTGYGLYRQIQALGHECMVVAPALIPKRSGERIKTNRRDAVTLARLGVWAPDAAHEAVRDLVRAKAAFPWQARNIVAYRSSMVSERRCREASPISINPRISENALEARRKLYLSPAAASVFGATVPAATSFCAVAPATGWRMSLSRSLTRWRVAGPPSGSADAVTAPVGPNTGPFQFGAGPRNTRTGSKWTLSFESSVCAVSSAASGLGVVGPWPAAARATWLGSSPTPSSSA